ncbi:hypothetical protein SASPL_135921 [Salvia splendens]|uniref:Uncharacterized protein n=1 Tax=Salvia splendens TaxID=180675 RepID=A0A8X8ZGE9_SALSN|nr:uncharacterized protein LOC121760738 [Salvia splendens]KAG6403693.1 hypothetical protein SASPL_135921 [Salvia splendens]
MGNCIFKTLGVVKDMVKVVTPDGGVMELYAPITAECVTNEFPGHAIFGSPRRSSPPLFQSESLCAGQYYYLLPSQKGKDHGGDRVAAPYRMSVDNQGKLRRLSEPEVFPKYNSTGVWKVRLVIHTDQLSEILSQEARTEALIESVRTAAKCAAAGVPSAANSERQSRTSAIENC